MHLCTHNRSTFAVSTKACRPICRWSYDAPGAIVLGSLLPDTSGLPPSFRAPGIPSEELERQVRLQRLLTEKLFELVLLHQSDIEVLAARLPPMMGDPRAN
jgi:hypothetical protein